MGFAAIEFNDAAVAMARGGVPCTQSPGYALVDDDEMLIGEEAFRQARLKPRLVSTRFWERLGNDPVFPASAMTPSFADLARAHLSRIWSSAGPDADGLILVVPASFEPRRLGLLLGIAEQLALPVRAMVDSALVGCRGPVDEDLIVHVDIHLHRTVVTGVELGTTVRRTVHRSLEGQGLIRLYDAWIRRIAAIFVQTTRFDPLHRAQTEQAIYDRLPRWLADFAIQDSIIVEITAQNGAMHAIRLSRDQMIECATEFYVGLAQTIEGLCGGRPFSLQLADGAARLPGLAASITSAVGQSALSLPSGAGAIGALKHSTLWSDGTWNNTLTVSLPRDVFAGQWTTEGIS